MGRVPGPALGGPRLGGAVSGPALGDPRPVVGSRPGGPALVVTPPVGGPAPRPVVSPRAGGPRLGWAVGGSPVSSHRLGRAVPIADVPTGGSSGGNIKGGLGPVILGGR
ncbi:hypothetical protein ABZS71_35530 [Streptomyces sp. NPDC005393]|uniref:hypothetical protein n=1 Tax=Streptomyces sp. NPDC005393 TaxID=3157041 RepID=UPI0033A0E539